MKTALKTALCLLLFGLAVTQQPYRSSSAAQRQSEPGARVLALIDQGDRRAADVINAPPRVRLNEDFQVTVTSFGGGCESAADVGVILTDSGATLMVYDFTTATQPGIACTMILKRLPHTATLRFTQAGEKLIRVWGRRAEAGALPLGVPVVLEQRLTVATN